MRRDEMTFRQAEKKLAAIAAQVGDCHAVEYRRFTLSSERVETKCVLYIGKVGHIEGPTWEVAFRNLDQKLNPSKYIERMPEVSA
ncbi:MAG: hypothetical protein BWY95_01328 [Bacteroidetes bacterium ADurb.BinA104]|nr:MAG: hypothetical protein BWY95_01328 [Bacteroidetes bacterium ADurb.BinA104]